MRELRRTQTDSEKAAWYLLRGRRLGVKFRRQCRTPQSSLWRASFRRSAC
ncbi:MAG: DUF559 domain-containing protein [Terriglobia bacterium]